jgi:DNA-binding beta-propeller fold protein YncE
MIRSLLFASFLAAFLGGIAAASDPEPVYRVFVGSEATDRISLVVFDGQEARVEREFVIGMYPTESDGPHGLAMSGDGTTLFITTGHGRPFGNLWKVDPATGRSEGRVELGFFPASLALSPDGRYAWVANFNLHGDMVPSSISVVETARMLEVSRIETCTMPHGSRLTPDGRLQYSTCMMDDVLIEIDAWSLSVRRHLRLTPGQEAGGDGPPPHTPHSGHGAHPPGADTGADTHAHVHHEPSGHGASAAPGSPDMPGLAGPLCSPTWAQPSADGAYIYVACNASDELVEVSRATWEVTRRIPAARGIYNLEVTSDGSLLVASNKQGHSISIFDVATGEERHRLTTLRSTVHGVVLSDDNRYAFVTVEGVGSEPGTLEVVDLAAGAIVSRVDLPPMSAGLTFWPSPQRMGTASTSRDR